MSTTTSEMLEKLGYFGNQGEESESQEAPASAPSAAAADATPDNATTTEDEAETVSLAEALAAEGLAPETAPQEQAAADGEAESASEEELEPSKLEKLEAEIARLQAENEQLREQEAEEQFEADWEGVVAEGVDFYQGLSNKIRERGRKNGRSDAEIEAAIKYMVYDGNEIERLGAEPGTPGLLEWQQTTLLNYTQAKVERVTAKPQPSEIERLTATYNLTEADQATLRQFVNYPPEAREQVAKALGTKNATSTNTDTKKQQAEEVAATRVAARLSQAPAPGVPGPAEKKKEYQYTHAPGVRRQETQLFAQRLGLLRG